jgi:hypothetical protein
MPYQLFLEQPAEEVPLNTMVYDFLEKKQKFIKEINELIRKYDNKL